LVTSRPFSTTIEQVFDMVALTEQGRKAAGTDASLLSDAELCDAALALEEQRRLTDAAQGHVLAELERRAVCERDHGLSTGGWLAREALLPSGVARARVKVGVALSDRFAQIDEALVEGRISWEHARVIERAANRRIADLLAQVQPELVAAAQGTLFDVWRRKVAAVVELLDEDGGHDPDDDLARNRLSLAKTFDGVTHLAGTLTGEHGLSVQQAVEAKADELFRRFCADREQCPELAIPSRATLRALALAELCRQAQGIDLDSTRAPRPDVTLAVNALHPHRGATTPDGTVVPDEVSRVLLCDPDLHPIVLNSLGVPLAMGHTVRYATPRQRRAIALRDGGCVFPGCGCPASWTDAHHVEPFTPTDGPTDLDNLAGLCRHHHRVTHRQGWTMTATPDGWFHWTTPTGHQFWSQRHGTQRHATKRAGPAPPRE
jgi:hypothetical protein